MGSILMEHAAAAVSRLHLPSPIENKLPGNGLPGLAGALGRDNGRSLIESRLSIRNQPLVELPSVSLEIPPLFLEHPKRAR